MKRTSVCFVLVAVVSMCSVMSFAQVTRVTVPLVAASMAGDIAQVRILLKQGAVVDAREKNGLTPLMGALLNRNRETKNIVKLLIRHGADVNAKTQLGISVLRVAIQSGQDVGVIKLLMNYGADINSKGSDGVTPLMTAADKGSLKVVKLLISRGALKNDRTPDGRTAVDFICVNWHRTDLVCPKQALRTVLKVK